MKREFRGKDFTTTTTITERENDSDFPTTTTAAKNDNKEKRPSLPLCKWFIFFSKCHLLDQGKSVFSRSAIKFQLKRFF